MVKELKRNCWVRCKKYIFQYVLSTPYCFGKSVTRTEYYRTTHSPSQSAPTILKNGAPCFLQKAGWKKQGHSLFKKKRDQAASSLFELQWPWFFALCFFQKAGCPIFKNQGARFLRIGGADWLGEEVNLLLILLSKVE